jgi:hypothetical protein
MHRETLNIQQKGHNHMQCTKTIKSTWKETQGMNIEL